MDRRNGQARLAPVKEDFMERYTDDDEVTETNGKTREDQ